MNKNRHDLSHPQKRIWYTEKMMEPSSIHNVGGLMKMEGSLDLDLFIEAIKHFVKTNDGIRLQFNEEEGNPYQYLVAYEDVPIKIHDFTREPSEFQGWYQEKMNQPYDLIDSPLYDFHLYKLGDRKQGLLFRAHHIIVDGWATKIVEEEISRNYKQLIEGRPLDWSERVSYIDYLRDEKDYLASERFEKNRAYWLDKFTPLPDHVTGSRSKDVKGERYKYILPRTYKDKLLMVLKEQKLSLSTFFIALEALYQSKVKNIDDVTIGVPVINRTGPDQKQCIGMFTSSMNLRVSVDNKASIREFIKHVSKELKYGLVNQKYPYDLLAKELNLSARGYEGLCDVYLNYYITDYSDTIDGVKTIVDPLYQGCQTYPMQVVIEEASHNDDIIWYFDYKVCDYSSQDIQTKVDFYLNLLDQYTCNPDQILADVSLEPIQALEERVSLYNQTEVSYDLDKTVIDLFEDRVSHDGQRPALYMGEAVMDYKRLSARVNQVANYLTTLGLVKGDVVALMADHSMELVVWILAVLKAGCTFVPIDKKYPDERVMFILEDTQAKLIYSPYEHVIEGASCQLVRPGLDYTGLSDEFSSKCLPDDLAYMIYTSGSTGRPKGVMISHRSLSNYAQWANETYLTDGDVFAFYSSLAFDLTITSIFAPLVGHHTMDIYPEKEDSFVLMDILERNRSSVIKLTPSHLELIKQRDNSKSRVRRFIVGGENLTASLCDKVVKSFHGVSIINEYGPTEATVGCMVHAYDQMDSQGSVAIGRPSGNMKILLLDKEGAMVSKGSIGEIYVSGVGLAQGYLNRPDLTEEKFVTLDSGIYKGDRAYRTGDLGQWINDHTIEYVGRADNQVKIRGHRIELEEISQVIMMTGGYDKCVTVVTQVENRPTVCSYVETDHETDLKLLKLKLKKSLPDYMVPTHIIEIQEIPLTVNGKVNTNDLPGIEVDRNQYVAGANDREKVLLNTMGQVLGLEHVGMMDNFFYLGGDSIKAIQLMTKLKEFGLLLKVQDIMKSPDISDMIHLMVEMDAYQLADQGYLEGGVDPTPISQWFFDQAMVNSDHYHQSLLVAVSSDYDPSQIEAGLNQVMRHHDSLRLVYDKNKKKLIYSEELLHETMPLYVDDISHLYETYQRQWIETSGSELKSSISLTEGPLVKWRLYHTGQGEHLLLLCCHHLIIDGVSWRLILEDLSDLLAKRKLGHKTAGYQAWASALKTYKGDLSQERIDYWTRVSQEVHAYDEPLKTGGPTGRHKLVLDRGSLDRFRENLHAVYSMDLKEALFSLVAISMGQAFHKDKLLFELEHHGRRSIAQNIDISRTVGWFTVLYPMVIKLEKNDMRTCVKSLKEDLRQVPEDGFDYGVLKYLADHDMTDKKMIRYNYLGESQVLSGGRLSLVDWFTGPDVAKENGLTSLMDIDCLLKQEGLFIHLTYDEFAYSQEDIHRLAEAIKENISILIDLTSDGDIEFTPSDFEVDIDQEDLDLLFD